MTSMCSRLGGRVGLTRPAPVAGQDVDQEPLQVGEETVGMVGAQIFTAIGHNPNGSRDRIRNPICKSPVPTSTN